MPGVLRLREFRLLFTAQAVSHLGDRMVNVALAFAVLETGGSASDVGLVFAARMVPLVACLLVGGVVADRRSRRAVMVASDLVRLVAQGATAALLIGGTAEVWSLALLAGVGGAATGFFSPASTGLLPLVVPAERLQEANGARATAMSAGEILGPVVAGVLVATVGAGWALGIDAATFLVSATLLLRLRLPGRAQRAAVSFVADLREGWGAFRSRSWVWTFVASAAAGNMLWGAFGVLGPVVASRELGGAAAWGTVVGAMGIGSVAGGVAAMRMRPRRPMLVPVVTSIVFGTPLALLAAGAPLVLLAAGAVVAGVSLMLGNTVWESTLQRHVPAESLSRVSAYDWFGSMAFTPLGYVAWGPLAEAIGLRPALWLAFGLLVAVSASLLLVPAIRELRDE